MLKLWWRSLFLAGVFSLSIVPVVQVRVFAQSSISIPSPVTVTSVRLNQTDSGLEIFLETTSKQPLSIVTSGYGKTFVANITNARLDLSEGKSFRQENPTVGITVVSVTPQGNNGIRVSAIGSEGLPTAKVRQSNGNSILSLAAPAAPTAQTPVSPPTIPQTPTQPEATTPEAEGESTPPAAPEPADTAPGEEMEIVVTGEQDGYSVTDTSTGTKTDTPLRDIPQSIQVVPQEVLRDQNINSLEDATRNVSGVTGTRASYVRDGIEPISLYASYIRSFTPAIGRSFDGSQFQPERGTQYEVGVKADLNDRLSATLALYDLTRSNVLTDDPINEGFSIQTGKQKSQGIELNISGEILPGWNVFGGYAYTNARITEDETFDVDNRLSSTPENAFNLWTTYEIQQGSLQGLGFGLGLYFVGEQQGDLANTFQLPSYFRTDASIFYKRDRFRAALNFRNLFDADYFEAATSRLRVFYGEPFTVQGTVSWEF
ncbi:TonB-dependent receptor [Chroococcidiopsidales cyanobacterium LEGE 13417]|nr:TonB-dependent receptor [Chroococcidiopsidales cyanobacterium LEGE 13417]